MLNKGQASTDIQGKSQLLQRSGRGFPTPCNIEYSRDVFYVSHNLSGTDYGCRGENTLRLDQRSDLVWQFMAAS